MSRLSLQDRARILHSLVEGRFSAEWAIYARPTIVRGAKRDDDSMWNNGLAEIQYYHLAKESERFGLFHY